VRVVLYDLNAARLGYGADRIHLATDASVVNDDNGLRPFRACPFDQLLIDIERVGPDIDKGRACPTECEGIRGRHEVNDGKMTSSPSLISISKAAIPVRACRRSSSAPRDTPTCSSRRELTLRVKGPVGG